MLSRIEEYFDAQEEPVKSCLLSLRAIILQTSVEVEEYWSYGMPFYRIHRKRFCYLRKDMKTGRPYIGIVNGSKVVHPKLVKENRSRMKVLYVDPTSDLPVNEIQNIIDQAIGSV